VNPYRRTAVVAGILYLVTHVTSIAALVLYGPVLTDRSYLLGPGADGRVTLGAFLEGLLALAIIGSAVALYPVVKRSNEGLALANVGLRVLESSQILVGVVCLLAVVRLRRDHADLATTELPGVGAALVAVHDWTFLLGPSFVLGVSTTALAYLMFSSRLVPRVIGVLGLIGGPLEFLSANATLFHVYSQVSVWGAVVSVPVFAWELSLALWLIIRGFRPAAFAAAESIRREQSTPLSPR
jgi:hypothetical protein